ncbi:succinate dehydrogenase subunit C [Palleronia aestuarii]|uniref:Succinate dehydrogenase cytochrome b556 subunit n=1 Tax=Palleronia aestuarii TaxID=568105 RepID=A0A2W7NDW5_9RHOB|nr:succinate dehydrogenase, cytochrome b556 subunit [Palleronia aestuarii]PZX18358.1 succinate dehydrogenase subunit C [Palleronia aestuarii]
MADVNRGNRPLSPHLTIYRRELNMVTSILTRITGNALVVGGLLVTWWLLAAASGPDAFSVANGVLTSWFGDLVMTLSLWALWYHTLAGLRHLYWDTGAGFDLERVTLLGWGVVGGSILLTILTLLFV